MIDAATLGWFMLGAAALIASPGPDFFYVVTRGLAQGRQAGRLSALGIGLGLLVHTSLAALGLTVLFQTSAWAFEIVKYAGAAYLLWMGVKMLCGGQAWQFESGQEVPRALIVRQAMLTNVLNPKAALTFLAFLPQFVRPERGGTPGQIALLGCVLALMAATWFCVVGSFAGEAGRWLSNRPRVAQTIERGAGLILIGLGVRLALTRR